MFKNDKVISSVKSQHVILIINTINLATRLGPSNHIQANSKNTVKNRPLEYTITVFKELA